MNFKSQNNLHFFLNKDKFIDPESKKIRVHEVSKYSLAAFVAVSWVFIIRWWLTAEDRAHVKAEKFLREKRERGEEEITITATQMMDEEYRSEYIEKTKRKYSNLIKRRQDQEMEQRKKIQMENALELERQQQQSE